MKAFLLIVLSLALTNVSQAQRRSHTQQPAAETTPRSAQFVDGPESVKRQVSVKVYDLSKIFSGEIEPNGTNTAWAAVTGKFVRLQSFSRGWVVDGTVNKKTATFVLRNPPQAAYDSYKRLKDQYNQMLAEFKAMSGRDYADIADTPELIDAAAALPAGVSLTNNPSAQDPDREARRQARQAALAQRSGGQYNGGGSNQDPSQGGGRHHRDRNAWIMDPAARQLALAIKKFDSKGFDLNAEFTIQCYGLKTPEKLENMFVFDHGRVVK